VINARRYAFTLIEILISLAIGMSMLAVAWSCLMQVQKTSAQTRAKVSLHQEAGVIHATLRERLSSLCHAAQFRIAVEQPNTANATLTIDALVSQRDAEVQRGRNPDYDMYHSDLVWCRFRWAKDGGSGRPTFSSSVSPPVWTAKKTTNVVYQSGIQTVTDPYGTNTIPVWVNDDIVPTSTTGSDDIRRTMGIGPTVRRDRRRHMDDNDLRLLPNITAAIYNDYTTSGGTRRALGDGEKLEARLSTLSERMTAIRVQLIDAQGMVTSVNPDDAAWAGSPPGAGITYVRNGASVTPTPPLAPDPDVWNASLRVLDGVWVDGRNEPCPAYAGLPSPALERPAIIRVAFTLADAATGISREFSFSYAPTPLLVHSLP
jgi:hypothetical protein